MDLFKNLNKNSTGFRFKVDGNIWRFLFNNKAIIAGESRDLKTKTTTYFCVNYKDNIVNFKDLEIKEKWWASLEYLTDNIIYISKFKKPDMPDQKGILSINIYDKNILWENEDITFLFADNEFTYGYRQLFESKKFYKLNNNTGEIVEELQESNINNIIHLKEVYDDVLYNDCIYPEQLNLIEDANSFVFNVINSIEENKKIAGFIEYILYEDLVVYNIHESVYDNKKNLNEVFYDNILKMYSKNQKKLIYNETINNNVTAFAPDSFFIKDKYLIYIKNKNELIVQNLKIFEDIN